MKVAVMTVVPTLELEAVTKPALLIVATLVLLLVQVAVAVTFVVPLVALLE